MLGYLSQTITRSPYGWKGPVGWGGPSSESLNEKLTEFSRQGRKFDGYHKMKTEEYLEATVRSREYKYVKGKGFEKEEQRPVKLFLFSGVRADYNIPDGGKDWEVRYAHPITTEDFSTVGIDRALEEVDFKFRDINKELEEIAKTGSFLYNAKTLPLEFTHTHFERTE
jgi:G3E family GTPase